VRLRKYVEYVLIALDEEEFAATKGKQRDKATNIA
jgi:hypothetical protein